MGTRRMPTMGPQAIETAPRWTRRPGSAYAAVVAAWVALSDKGYKFKGTSPNGLSLALLKGGSAGKSKALAKGKGATLPDPTLPLAFPVTAQLRKSGSPLCLESTFASTDAVKNDGAQFKAKH